ncbi:MAG: RAD55 family ATPase [Thermoanaerobaculia bacterium]
MKPAAVHLVADAEVQPRPGSASPPAPPDDALFFTAADELRARHPLGPAVATGLPSLDESLEGGFRSGTHVVLVGPPESGKTTFATHSVARWLDSSADARALVYARDEAPGASVNRLGQRLGFDRAALRRNDPEVCEQAAAALEERWGPRLQFLDPFRAPLDVLVLKAAELRAAGPTVVLVDSLQVARTEAGERAGSQKDRVDAAMAVGSELASRGDLVLSLSQSSRAGYAEPKNGRDPRAEGSGSAGIEFNADLLLGFTSKAEDDPSAPRTVTVRKGRGGLAKATVSFVIDRETTIVREVDRDATDEAEAQAAAARLRPCQDAILAELRKAAAAGERRSGRALEAAISGNGSLIRAALKALVIVGEVFFEEGPRRAILYYLPTGKPVRPSASECVPDALADDAGRECVLRPYPEGEGRTQRTQSTGRKRGRKSTSASGEDGRTQDDPGGLP